MDIKIKNNNEYIPATLEVVDGVMIVSPKEEKVDITKFKDGDVVVYHYGDDASTIAILQGEVDTISKYLFIEDYVSLDSVEGLLLDGNYTDAATDVRYATEEEKQKLNDALAKEGKTWDAEKKEVVDLKWKPKINEAFYFPLYELGHFIAESDVFFEGEKELLKTDTDVVRGWVFRSKEECEAFCLRLNEAIKEVKP